MWGRAFISAGMLLAAACHVQAAEVHVAVAANFTTAAEAIAAEFEVATGNTVILSFGATGGLYAQITQGAPFEVFLAADDDRPTRAVAEGHGVAGTVFTYAVGWLALYSPVMALANGRATLEEGNFQHLAIADPETAPYGAAAMQALASYGLTERLNSRLVTGQNIAQTLQFIESGSAELGFVALSQVAGRPAEGVWLVPETDHAPIRQDAVLLNEGADNKAATDFLAFLKGETATSIMRDLGYGTGDGGTP